jgi:HEAT repeats
MEWETPQKRPRTVEVPTIRKREYSPHLRCPSHHLHQHDESPSSLAIQQILSGLQQVVTTKERVHILHELLHFVEFDRENRRCRCQPWIVSLLVRGGVIQSLCLQLGYVLNRHGSHEEEISLILESMDVFYRYCPELVTEDSIRTQGPELLCLLPRVLQTRNGTVDGVVESTNTCFLPVVSIWHSCSSCGLGSTLLLQHPATLPAIHEMLQERHGNLDGIMESLGLLKNLTYFGEDHRHRIADHPVNLITTLTGLTGVFEDKAKERLSAVFRNLALSTDVRQRLAQRTDVLTAVVRMAASCCDSSINEGDSYINDNFMANNHKQDINARRNVVRNVLSTLASLALDSHSTPWMVFHGDGILVDQLKRFMTRDEDPVVRKRATRALRLLARETSAPVMLKDNQLLEALSRRALHDSSEAVRTEAVEAFAQCASLVGAHSQNPQQYQTVLDLLTELATSPEVSTDVVARSLQEQASRPENRKAMAQRKGLVEAMARIALSSEVSRAAKECICTALVDLSHDEANHEAIAIPAILDALVKVLSDRRVNVISEGWVNDENQNNGNISGSGATKAMKESTVRTILNLAKTPSNRKIMASQTALLQSLLRVAAATSTDGLKKEVKGAILHLASEL